MHKSLSPWWGLLPLVTAVYTTLFEFVAGHPAHALWICNICNFILAAGIILRIPWMVTVSTLWLVIASPLWMWDMVERGTFITIQALFTHIGGAILGLVAMYRNPGHPAAWWRAALLGAALMLLSRWLAPPNLNINMSAAIYQPLTAYFNSFWQYALFNIISFCLALMGLEYLLRRLVRSNVIPTQ